MSHCICSHKHAYAHHTLHLYSLLSSGVFDISFEGANRITWLDVLQIASNGHRFVELLADGNVCECQDMFSALTNPRS